MSSRKIIQLQWDRNSDPQYLYQREWLLTNGLGGYSSGTLLGVATRRYHGLFVPNLSAPKGRHVLISRYDEEVQHQERQVLLGGGDTAQGEYSGDGHRYLMQFTLEDHIATWIYDFGGTVLERSVVMAYGQNTVCVRYRLLEGDALRMRLRPYLAFRRHDELNQPGFDDFTLTIRTNQYEVRHSQSPVVLRLSVQPDAVFAAERSEIAESMLRVERTQGYAHLEPLTSLGHFAIELVKERPVTFVASTHAWERLDFDAAGVFAAERQRVARLVQVAEQTGDSLDEFTTQLVAAADQFVVLPGSRLEETVTAEAEGSKVRTVIAGYHWFGDWGRDTMISLEGLTLCTGRLQEARDILRTFARYVSDGLLPNLLPERERQGLYHTVDATLWYFHAIHRYVERSGDRAILDELLPVLRSIFEHHVRGTSFGIHVDPADGLLSAGQEGYQLTWMDAKVDGWVVTPRRGKPVEVQALWYNALRLLEQWSAARGEPAFEYGEYALQAKRSFHTRFWNEATGCLFDVVDGERGDDPAIRPNQIFSISLPHAVLDPHRWRAVIDTVEKKLLTPFGLRTLSREHPDYKANYQGDLRARDAAYHQGTVWPWLMGHFIDAWLKTHGDVAQARQMLQAFPGHLRDEGIGSISEIFDAEFPHLPQGCIAQAWSVAEILRAWQLTRG